MSTNSIRPRLGGLTNLALAAAAETVRSHRDDAITEKAIGAVESQMRLANLEAGRRELCKAADKAVAGAAISAAFQFAAAGAQFASAGALTQAADLTGKAADAATASSKAWDAVGNLNLAFAKGGDILSATGQYDQARKVEFDKSAEALQLGAQEAERARSSAKEAAASELAAMKDIIAMERDAARAATRA
jgi:hypothetical protein